jgi:hypothetical protein
VGATLRFAKVIDADRYQRSGARVEPGTPSIVRLPGEAPATALPFLVIRAWDDIEHGGVTESWRIQGAHGETLHEGVERTVLPDQGPVADEVDGFDVEYADDGYTLVLLIDDREVARADFPVVVDETGERLAE